MLAIIGYLFFQNRERVKIIGVSQWGSNPEFARSVEGFKESPGILARIIVC